MREIKFRMWNPCGDHYHHGEGVMECLKQQVCGLYDHEKEYGAVFEQFTGLVDKNGKEIYEGDIILFPSLIMRPIVWKDGALGYVDTLSDFHAFGGHNWFDELLPQLEVMGNIHENPDLLEAK